MASVTDSSERDIEADAEFAGAAAAERDTRAAAMDRLAGRVDTAMVLAWVGLATVACCGLGGIVSLVATILGIVRLRAVRGLDRGLTARARGAVAVGVIGTLLGTAIITWFLLSVVPEFSRTGRDDITCMFFPCSPAPAR